MASEEHRPVYNEVDLDEEDEDVDSPNEVVDDDDEDDEDDSTSSSNLATATDLDPPLAPIPPPVSSVGEVTVAVSGDPTLSALPDPKRQRVDVDVAFAGEKKVSLPLDESRRLFQRLWTDEDEIELLQGFLEYTSHRGPHQHHDTSAFYDQIKSKLQLDFNKNQLVEKLRRLKKKYRNVLNKISSGKEFVFKSPHDQATFEISCRLWSGIPGRAGTTAVHVAENAGFDDEDGHTNANPNSIDHNTNNGLDINSSERKGSKSRKLSRGVKIEERPNLFNSPAMPQPVNVGVPTATTGSIPNLIEETVKSCLSPLFKELLHSVMNVSCNSRSFGLSLSPMPLGFSGGPLNFTGCGDMTDEKWRKQQILELEVYSKRLELVQGQIKAQLDELRSMETS